MLPVALRVKELNGESYTLYWMELEEVHVHVRMPGDLETRLCLRSMRTNLKGGYRGKCFANYRLYCNVSCRFPFVASYIHC